jgi:hypothetical protein
VSQIPIKTVFDTATFFDTGKSGKIQVMCLELLLICKLRASRPQDIEDIQEILRRKSEKVNWILLAETAEEMEVKNLRTAAAVFAKKPKS